MNSLILKKPKRITLEKLVVLVYLYTLPLRIIAPLSFLKSIFSVCATYTTFLVHCIGLVVLYANFRRNGKKENERIECRHASQLRNRFVITVIALDSISFTMAIILAPFLGTIDGENTINGVSTILIYYLQYALMIIFNCYLFKLLTRRELLKILNRIVLSVLGISYVQLFAMLIGGPFASMYNVLNFHGAFRDYAYIVDLQRLPLLFSEPAAAGGFIGIFILPIILGQAMSQSYKNKYALLKFVAWIPIIYYTKSSTAYLLLVVNLLVFVVIQLKKGITVRNVFYACGVLVLSVLVLIGNYGEFLASNEIARTITYYFEKITNLENESTVTRVLPTYINFRIFFEYPILGIGNGNQGFFYQRFFPAWGDVSSETFGDITGIADGGVALPSILSGYGIVGLMLVLAYFRKAKIICKRYSERLGCIKYIYTLAIMAILVNAFQGDYFGLYYVFFMISLPMAIQCKDEK